MPTVTVSARIFSSSQLKLLDKLLKSMLKGLEVETEICGVSPSGWVEITVSGEDEKAALHYLAEEIGLCPRLLESVEKFSTVKGYVTASSKKKLHIDVGIFSSNTTDVAIPIKRLQTQLVDGRKIALKKISKLYGLVENLPLSVKVYNVDNENKRVEAALSEKQLNLYRSWTKSLLDRLIVLGVPFNRVMVALKRTRCNRYVVDVKSLGLFEQTIVCRLGTDAAGLIPKIGGSLSNASFSVFNPKEITRFLGCY
jgi:hypothetical protein